MDQGQQSCAASTLYMPSISQYDPTKDHLLLVWQRYGHVCCWLRAVALTNSVTFRPVRWSGPSLTSLHQVTAYQAFPFSACNIENIGGPEDEAETRALKST